MLVDTNAVVMAVVIMPDHCAVIVMPVIVMPVIGHTRSSCPDRHARDRHARDRHDVRDRPTFRARAVLVLAIGMQVRPHRPGAKRQCQQPYFIITPC